MIRNYFKVAYRHLLSNKVLSLINITGLSVGMAAFVLIIQYVSFECSYDEFHINKGQIYRLAYRQYRNGEIQTASARNFIGIPSLIKEHFPEVTAVTGFDRTAQQAYFLFSYEGRKYYEPGSFYQTDSSFFQVFPSLLLKGDRASVLSDPHNLVLSERMARKIFGDEDPIGKKLSNGSPSYSQVTDFVITGVMKDVPENAHFHLNFITRNSNAEEVDVSNYWTGPRFYTYLTLMPGTDPELVSARFNHLIGQLQRDNPKTEEAEVFLQQLGDIHLQSDLQDELEANVSDKRVYILAAVGIMVLLLAWINYVNIEAARFIVRTREMGIRRILGSGKADLALQFLVEYWFTALLAMAIAAALVYSILPKFSYITGVPISQFQWSAPVVWLAALALFVTGSVVTGMYPAWFLVGARSLPITRARASGSMFGSGIRRSLTVVQFACSISLVAFVLVIRDQINFMRVNSKGIDIDHVISIRNPTVYANEDSVNLIEFRAFENRLLQDSKVKQVTSSSAIPGMEVDETFTNRLKVNLTDPYDPTGYKMLFIDYNFIPFYALKLKAGRNYSPMSGDDENWNTVILNERAARALGFNSAEQAKDQEVNLHLWGGDFKKYKIVGVLEDYHHEAIKTPVYPTIYSLNHSQFQQVFYAVRFHSGTDSREGLAIVERCWKAIFPDKPLEYFFQDDYYDRQFKSELHFGRIFGLFAGVATFIACMGIMGATLFETTARLKEVSIRKVLGATIGNLIALLSMSNLRLIMVSGVIGVPIIYACSSWWLSSYPLRIELGAWIFLSPLLALVVLVAVTCGFQLIKTAVSNPIDQLKHE